MNTSPDCPYCRSYDTRPLNPEAAGILGYRCHDCSKVFYIAAPDVAKRVRDPELPPEPCPTEDDPFERDPIGRA